jgi:hypothetical protein
MPQKIRELKSLLLQAGFSYRPGKGSDSNWYHPLLAGKVTLFGKDGNDAKAYQEKDVNNAIQRVENTQKAQEEEESE